MKLVQLGELVTEISTKNKAGQDIPVYSVTNDAGFMISTDYFSKEVFSKNLTTYKIVELNNFAYNPSRINVGSIDYFQFQGKGLVSPLYVTFEANENILPAFLKYYLKSPLGNAQIRANTTGSVRDTLGFKQLSRIKIPLLPVEKQKDVVLKLDLADSLRQKRKQAIDLLDEYLKSVFLDMFGDPTNNQKGFKVGKISDLVSEVRYGTSAPASDNGTFPYLRMNNITYSGEMDFTSLKYIDIKESDKSKYIAQQGDLLFNRTNSKELVVKTAVFNKDFPMVIAGYLIRVRTNEYALPEYISGYLNSAHGKLTLSSMCKNIVGMANINAKELQSIRILIPPIDLQEIYREAVKEVRTIKEKMLDQSNELDNHFQALMQNMFINYT